MSLSTASFPPPSNPPASSPKKRFSPSSRPPRAVERCHSEAGFWAGGEESAVGFSRSLAIRLGQGLNTSVATAQPNPEILVRALRESDLADADRIVRVAFGTFLGMPDPNEFMGDAAFVQTRWLADPNAVLAAEHNGKLIGSNFATNWGSFGFFGPLTVEPKYWNRGVAQKLLGPTMEIFRRWGNRHLGLYTFPHSPKHMALYQKFGFWPRDLVVNFSKTIDGAPEAPRDVTRFSESKSADRESLIATCREVTDAIFEGLDVQREIRAGADQGLGDTILAWDDSR